MLATSFHPEVGVDNAFHELFVDMCIKALKMKLKMNLGF